MEVNPSRYNPRESRPNNIITWLSERDNFEMLASKGIEIKMTGDIYRKIFDVANSEGYEDGYFNA